MSTQDPAAFPSFLRPIETAPRDATEVLLTYPVGHRRRYYYPGWWCGKTGQWVSAHGFEANPDKWCPLPIDPDAGKEVAS